MLGLLLLQLVDLLDEGAELHFHGALELNLYVRLDDCQLGSG